MKKLLLLAALLLTANAFGQAIDPPHWSYEGEAGPESWGDLDEAYQLCASGTEQSPIDLAEESFTQEDLQDIVFDYQPTALTLLNNGHTIQVPYDAGSTIMLSGEEYELLQFHFHTPSEHALEGNLLGAELHFVHRRVGTEGDLAVVGVLIEEGAENEALAPVLANAPEEEGETETEETVDANALLPEGRATYRYPGSLTTPPCSQGVRWNVLAEPIEMSAAQIETLFSIIGESNRPLQPLGDRVLLEDSSTEE